MRNLIGTFLLISTIGGSLAIGQQNEIIKGRPFLTLRQMDGSSDFEVRVFSTGKVEIVAIEGGVIKKRSTKEISDGDLKKIRDKFRRSRFFSLRNRYVEGYPLCKAFSTDSQTLRIEFTAGRQRKVVEHYLGCDDSDARGRRELKTLEKIEKAIESVIGTRELIKMLLEK